MRGNFTDNETYCSKQGILVYFGEKPVCNGGRSDRNEIFRLLINGATELEVMQHDFARYCQQQRGIDRYFALKVPEQREERVRVYLYFGPPGVGKTEHARAQFSPYYMLPIGKNFWLTPAAHNAQHVIIDDFKKNLYLQDLLRLLDNYPLEAERKGGHLWWYPKTIIITTNWSPHAWYTYDARANEKQALFRRFTQAYRFFPSDDRKPHPVEIDITKERHFEDDYVPGESEVVQPRTVWSSVRQRFECEACNKVFCECL